MAKYRVLIKSSAVKDIEVIPLKKDSRRIVERMRKLEESPRPTGREKLSGQDKYRVRQGHYRIVYSIEDQDLVVYVVRA